ncbi:MAG: class F sortase [Candidatus Taylorbacteria bacterium]|nr:class F sortase [Candidatus Taylorbacteria bacterium]
MENTPAQNVLQKELAYKERTTFGRPVYLKIPAIKVSAKLENVGLKQDGTIGTPKGPVNSGWFYPGSIPGQRDNSIIDGHYGWKDNIQAVFDNLSKLTKGDKIYVEDQKGITIVFVVSEVKTFSENDDTGSIYFSSDGKAHLNLITCGGIWDKAGQSYSNRVVAFADLSVE